jgi:deoxyribose-phosphate aldolase
VAQPRIAKAAIFDYHEVAAQAGISLILELLMTASEYPAPAAEQDLSAEDLAKCIDHTLLKAEATQAEILRICDEAVAYGFHAVCVNGRWLSLVADRLHETPVQVAGVVSLPLGADTTKVKAAQAQDVIYAGADEIDMVADLAAIIESDDRYLLDQLMTVLRVCRTMRPAVLLKVIIESAALTYDQKVFACRIAQAAGVDYVKTSTGLHPAGGATVEDVRLMKESAPRCRIKAAGGIKTASQALAMREAGADRIGTSAGVAIIEEMRAWPRNSSASPSSRSPEHLTPGE